MGSQAEVAVAVDMGYLFLGGTAGGSLIFVSPALELPEALEGLVEAHAQQRPLSDALGVLLVQRRELLVQSLMDSVMVAFPPRRERPRLSLELLPRHRSQPPRPRPLRRRPSHLACEEE